MYVFTQEPRERFYHNNKCKIIIKLVVKIQEVIIMNKTNIT